MKKPNLSRPVWLDHGWQPVAVAFIPSKKAWDSALRSLPADPEPYPGDRSCGGSTSWKRNDTTGKAVILVTVNDSLAQQQRDGTDVVLTMVHEAVHVWQFICEQIGEEKPGIEVEAYAIENITRQLLDAYVTTQGAGKDWLAKEH